MKVKSIILTVLLLSFCKSFTQDIELFEQFNGRYDYTAIGNTLNPAENNGSTFCNILDSSSATLNLDTNYTIVRAILYWAGSGEGDTNVMLNGLEINANDTYNVTFNSTQGVLTYFSSFADVTSQVIAEGNINYTFSGLDINNTLTNNTGYCQNRTNFGGWSIYVIYEDNSLPLNQISLFQGLEIINRNVQEKEIVLNNINVLDNVGAKIGFLAWEGDNSLNIGETLSINNNALSNPPLNLANNAFNGTNTFTNSTNFYNADLDVYNIENNIVIGDTSVSIKLTTQADLIILNNIITILNSQLPDATISINNYNVDCGESSVELLYTITNSNSTAALPAGTSIAFYSGSTLLGQTTTQNTIAINDTEDGVISFNIPENLGTNITITGVVDDNDTVQETNESNNTTNINIELLPIPDVTILPNLLSCNEGFQTGTYNLYDANENLDPNDISFYTSLDDLENINNAIVMPENYNNTVILETIYIRLENTICYEIFQFKLNLRNCPPFVPQGFSPNNDSTNDWFNIQGLYNIFTEHELKIYNRLGNLIYVGDNDSPWYGIVNKGIGNHGSLVPVGTYYYILHLNDSNYQDLFGWVYVNY